MPKRALEDIRRAIGAEILDMETLEEQIRISITRMRRRYRALTEFMDSAFLEPGQGFELDGEVA